MKRYLSLFILLIFSCYNSLYAQDPEGTASSNKPVFGLESNVAGAGGNGVNMFTGDVLLPVNLVSLPTHNGIGINVGINYNSNIDHQVKVWNEDMTTGILGLGWDLSLSKIIVDNNNTGVIDDDKFYLSLSGKTIQFINTETASSNTIYYFTAKGSPNMKVTYYLGSNKWTLIMEDGSIWTFGENSNAISYTVHWDGWMGSSSLNTNQTQAADAWFLSKVKYYTGEELLYTYTKYEELVGVADGANAPLRKMHTREVYLNKISDSFGQSVNFYYEDKSTTEYVDVHQETTEPDSYQEKYETKYLDRIETKSQYNNIIFITRFEYIVDNILSNNTLVASDKRFLVSISQETTENNHLSTMKFDYYDENHDPVNHVNEGKLKRVTYNTGSYVQYEYSNGIQIGHSNREFTVVAPDGFAEPRVFIQEEYVVVMWRGIDGTNTHSQDLKPVIIDVYTWEGEWVYQRMNVIERIPLENRQWDEFKFTFQKDFFAILALEFWGEDHYNLCLYRRDKTKRGTWLKEERVLEKSPTNWLHLGSGSDFVRVTSYQWGGIQTFILTGDEWRDGGIVGGGGRFYGGSANNYVINHNESANPDIIDFSYLDLKKEWHTINLNAIGMGFANPTNDNYESFWIPSYNFFVGMANNNHEYIYTWDENYNFKKRDIGFHNDWANVVVNSSAIGILDKDNVTASVYRYDGNSWHSLTGLTFDSYNFHNCSLGDDLFVRVDNNYTHVGKYNKFNPNANSWISDVQFSSSSDGPYTTVTGTMYRGFFYFKQLFYKDKYGSYSQIAALPSNKNIDYTSATTSFPSIWSGSTTTYQEFIYTVKNGVALNFTLSGTRKLVFGFSQDVAQRSYLSGYNTVVSYSSPSSLEDATELYINRIVNDDVQGNQYDYPVTKVIIFDGSQERVITYQYTASSATIDPSGRVAAYNEVEVVNGNGKQYNGFTKYYFYNNLPENESIASPFPVNLHADAQESPVLNYSLLQGQIYKILEYQLGNLVSTTSNAYVVKKQLISGVTGNLDMGYLPLPSSTITDSETDLSRNIEKHNYYNTKFQLETNVSIGQYDQDVDVNIYVTRYTYAWQKYSGMVTDNVLNSICEQKTYLVHNFYDDVDPYKVEVTTYGQFHGKYQPNKSYRWRGTGGTSAFVFDFSNWSGATEPNANWYCTNRFINYDTKFNLLESENEDGVRSKYIWSHNGLMNVADVYNPGTVQILNEDFNDDNIYNNDPVNWVQENPNWIAENGVLKYTHEAASVISPEKEVLGENYIIEFEAYIPKNQNGSLGIEFSKGSPYTSGGVLLKIESNNNISLRQAGVLLTGTTVEVIPGPTYVWHQYRIYRKGQILKVYVDGNEILFYDRAASLPADPYLSFTVSNNVNAEFDNLRVYAADAIMKSVSYDKDYKYISSLTNELGSTTRYLYNKENNKVAEIDHHRIPTYTYNFSLSSDRHSTAYAANDPNISLNTVSRDSKGLYEDFETAGNKWTKVELSNGNTSTWVKQNKALVHQNIGTNGRDTDADSYLLDFEKEYTGKVGIEFDIKLSIEEDVLESTNLGFEIGIGGPSWNGTLSGTEMASRAGYSTSLNLQVYNPNNTYNVLNQNLPIAKRYRVKIILDTETERVDYYIGGKLLGEDLPFYKTSSSISKLAFLNFGAENDNTWEIDNITVYADPLHTLFYKNGLLENIQIQKEDVNNQILVSEIIRDDLGREAVVTKPTLISSRFAYQPNFVTSFDWINGIMSGDVVGINSDGDYPYSRNKYENNPLGRVVEIGKPGINYAINNNSGKYYYSNNVDMSVFGSYYNTTEKRYPVTHYVDPDNVNTYTLYDKVGNVLCTKIEKDGIENYTRYEYDDFGNVLRIFPPNVHETPSNGSNPEDFIIHMTYDLWGRKIEKMSTDEGVTKYYYDDKGRLRFSQDQKQSDEGTVVYTDYDYLGKLTETGYISNAWDLNYFKLYDGLPSSLPNKKWKKKYYYGTHDNQQNLYNVNSVIKVEINNDSDLDPEIIEEWNYSSNNNVSSKKTQSVELSVLNNGVINYDYDNSGQVLIISGEVADAGQIMPMDPIHYTYDIAGRMKSVGNATDKEFFINYFYGVNGELSEELRNQNSVSRTYSYNSPGWLLNSTDPFFYQNLEYNNSSKGLISNISNEFYWTGNMGNYRYEFEYDYLSRLTNANNTSNSDYNFSVHKYDANGNYEQVTYGNEYREYQYLPGTNKVTNVNGNNSDTYDHDANGNVTFSSRKYIDLIKYDRVSNMPMQMNLSGAGASLIKYQYGSSNQRIVAREEYAGANRDVFYVLNNSDYPNIEVESDNGHVNQITFNVYGQNGLVAFQRDNRWSFVLPDYLGSTRVVFDQGNNVTASYDYLPTGGMMRSMVAEGTNYCYTGQEYDQGSALHNYRARLYDSDLGRFYAVDPLEQDHNPYAYCGNNSINRVDIDGKAWHLLIGAVVGGTLNVITHWNKIDNFGDGLMAFGIGAVAGTITAATGGASAAALGYSVNTFVGGAIAGATGAIMGSPIQGIGNAVYFGDKYGAKQFGIDVLSGAVVGGIAGSISKYFSKKMPTSGTEDEIVESMPKNGNKGTTSNGLPQKEVFSITRKNSNGIFEQMQIEGLKNPKMGSHADLKVLNKTADEIFEFISKGGENVVTNANGSMSVVVNGSGSDAVIVTYYAKSSSFGQPAISFSRIDSGKPFLKLRF